MLGQLNQGSLLSKSVPKKQILVHSKKQFMCRIESGKYLEHCMHYVRMYTWTCYLKCSNEHRYRLYGLWPFYIFLNWLIENGTVFLYMQFPYRLPTYITTRSFLSNSLPYILPENSEKLGCTAYLCSLVIKVLLVICTLFLLSGIFLYELVHNINNCSCKLS